MHYVDIKDFDIDVGSKADATLAVINAIEKCREYKNVTLIFPKGTYHFWPDKAFEGTYFISNHDDDGLKRVAFPVINFDDITIDGQGSDFIFHGIMIPFVIEHSSKVIIKNMSIDWEKPFYSQGTILDVSSECIELGMSNESSYKIQDGQIFFIGEGWSYSPWGFMEFDAHTKGPAYGSWDDPLGTSVGDIKFEQGEGNRIRLRGNFKRLPEVGNKLLIRCANRNGAGIFIKDSRDILLEQIDIHYVNGMGIIAQKSQDISLNRANVRIRPGSDRIFTAFADATHFVNCKGVINISDCLFENQADDATNVHGIYTAVEDILSSNSILAKLMHYQHKGVDICDVGDQIAFVNNDTLLTYGHGRVSDVKRINRDYFIITFEDDLPDGIQEDHVIENITWMPELIIKNCTARCNRARGFLITTPKKVLIENNSFSIPGSAIKISGDANSWFESGSVGDITIRKNKFMDCNYVYGPWGRAVIDIDPEIRKFDEGRCYHSNISIEDNLFSTFSTALVWGYSVKGFKFTGNTIEPTDTYPQNENNQYALDIKYCKDVYIDKNICSRSEQVRVNNKISKMD
ncbi:alpha-1,3-galactosidase-related protein [Xylanivirga thermophila]|uniref:alpha-1,3-galactosidase-related protein n=1 Tax=Xylanivirga thermophila TaxID=2496273 RepID=UPI00101D3F24|nr:hypothetical protein [Xylanivirga thermophila]